MSHPDSTESDEPPAAGTSGWANAAQGHSGPNPALLPNGVTEAEMTEAYQGIAEAMTKPFFDAIKAAARTGLELAIKAAPKPERKQYLITVEDGTAEAFTARPIHDVNEAGEIVTRFVDVRDYRHIFPAETDYLEDK